MIRYIIRRILWAIPVLLIISLVTFALMHAVPGGPFDNAEQPLPPEVIKNLEEYYNLNAPLWKQYVDYISNLVRGDFGPSYVTRGRTVNNIIAEHLPVSFQLGVTAFLLTLLIGIPLGILAALKQNSFIDYFSMFFATAGVSIPSMTLGPLLIWIFALKFQLLPVARWGTFAHLILPAITLGVGPAARLARLTRASMLQVIQEDYIRTARAKGLSERIVVVHHALKNALISVITVIGPMFAGLVTGSMIVEQIFAIPGMGKFFVQSVNDRDYPVIMATVLLFAIFLVFSNLAVDVAYAFVDPRLRYD